MQNAVVVYPGLHGRLADDDLFEKISRVFQRPKLCLHFGRVAHVQGRLDIVFLCAPIDNKIDLALFSGLFLFHRLRDLHHADIY